MTTVFRPIEEPDCGELIRLLGRVRPSIARVTSATVYRATVRNAMHDPRAIMVVAVSGGRMAGYVLAVTEWHAFWRSFLFHHPLCAVPITFKRIFAALRTNRVRDASPPVIDDSAYVSEPADSRSWSDSSRTIAKIVHIGVDSEFRNQRIGSGLYKELLKILALQGVHRVDACIDSGNAQSLHLHARTGWRIHRASTGYFATLDLESVNYA